MRHNLSILYVEDDTIVRENFQELLEHYFSKVITADNGKTALELYERFKPDVALLDISIPHINGLDVASKIRESDSEIQIIMLTAYDDKNKLFQAVNLQLFAYLVKPVQRKIFDETLTKLLNKVDSKTTLELSNSFLWNKTTKELLYKDENIKLTNHERLVLALLCNYQNQYFSACDIAIEVLENYNMDDIECNNIVQLLSRFKKKILKQFDIKNFFIESGYGVGYKIILQT